MNSDNDMSIESARKAMTSKEALILFELFTELMTAKKFTNNDIFEKNDAVAIMEYADAYTVLNTNEKAKGICMTNIAHIYYKNKDYKKASTSYHKAANWARRLFEDAKDKGDSEEFDSSIYLYCKRKYYEVVCLFKDLKRQNYEVIEKKVAFVEAELESIK